MSNDTWNHVVFVFSASENLIRGYHNGTFVEAKTPGHALVPLDTTLSILLMRDRNRSDHLDAEGTMDDFRLYNRALSSVEVGELFGGLAAYYPFDGNANDASGNSNNPVAINGVTYTADRFGIANAAARFDGNSDINYGTTALPETGKGSFSVSFWINASVQDGYVLGTKVGGSDPGPYWTIQCENTPQDGLGVRLDLSDGTNSTPGDSLSPTTG